MANMWKSLTKKPARAGKGIEMNEDTKINAENEITEEPQKSSFAEAAEAAEEIDLPRPEIPDLDELAAMNKADMIELCRAWGLPIGGVKSELFARLKAKKLGGDKRIVHGNTLCPYCQKPARVSASRTIKIFPDGRILKQYSMRCQGKHCHRWSKKQVEGTYQGG